MRTRRQFSGSLAQVRPLEDPNLDPAVQFIDMNLHEEPLSRRNITLYYRICRDSPALHVTTSCFAVWKRHRHTNGFAKIIPALREGTSQTPVRVFFFDDNLELDGSEAALGICNLRDAHSGEFVDYTSGRNGFKCTFLHGHTVVHHSEEYRNVLVKANILDAIGDDDYFWSIIKQYSRPGEKLMVFMDVNSTIMCNDTSARKDTRSSLLSIMFELIEVKPLNGSFEFSWASHAPFIIQKPMTLKQFVKAIHHLDKEACNSFWNEENCVSLLERLVERAELSWLAPPARNRQVTAERFSRDFMECLSAVTAEFAETGIAKSWFRCYERLRQLNSSVILNSFGVDTRKVVLATVPDESQVKQITVNYELWEDSDKNKFRDQYRVERKEVLAQGTPEAKPLGKVKHRTRSGHGISVSVY